MNSTESLLLTLFLVCLYATLFLFIGTSIIKGRKTFPAIFDNPSFATGSSFFIGAVAFLFSWICAAKIFDNPKAALYLITFAGIAWIAANRPWLKLRAPTRKEIAIFISLVVTVSAIKILGALVPMPAYFVTNRETVNPLAGFGAVVHSFRAANLSEHMVQENEFPIINQHSGQSIIASIPMFIGIDSPQLSLVLWLSVFITFFILLTHGFATALLESPKLALIPTLIVFFGNTVLSPIYSSITDTESALFLTSNLDSIFGIATFLLFSLMVFQAAKDGASTRFGVTAFIIAVLWNVTSGQSILLSILIFGPAFFFFARQAESSRKILGWTLAFFCGALVGVVALGGTLSPSAHRNDITIPGLMKVRQDGVPALSLRFPRTVESGSDVIKKVKLMLNGEGASTGVAIPAYVEPSLKESVKENGLFFAAAKIARSIQAVFFPIVGLLLAFFLIRTRAIGRGDFELIRYFVTISATTFAAGWVLSTCFDLYGYTRELTKFLYFGSFSSMLLLGISLSLLAQRFRDGIKIKGAIYAIIIFVVLGPIAQTATQIAGNFLLAPDQVPVGELGDGDSSEPMSVPQRFDFLINSHGIYGK